jgi:chitinase
VDAAYPFTKFYVSLLTARRGFTDPGALRRLVLPVVQKAANYVGVILWDRYFDKRSNYSGSIKSWV